MDDVDEVAELGIVQVPAVAVLCAQETAVLCSQTLRWVPWTAWRGDIRIPGGVSETLVRTVPKLQKPNSDPICKITNRVPDASLAVSLQRHWCSSNQVRSCVGNPSVTVWPLPASK